MAGAGIDVMALASIRATREATVSRDGHVLPVIVGTPMAGETIDGELFDGIRNTAVFPGDLPRDPQPLFEQVAAQSDQAFCPTSMSSAFDRRCSIKRHRASCCRCPISGSIAPCSFYSETGSHDPANRK
jgi:predicted YcjX-like family ATPase